MIILVFIYFLLTFVSKHFAVSLGIECPRSARNMPGGMQVAEPFSDQAMLFTKELVLQREVSGDAELSGRHFFFFF